MKRQIASVLVVASVLAVGCGGDDDAAESTAAQTTVASGDSAEAAESPVATTDASDTVGSVEAPATTEASAVSTTAPADQEPYEVYAVIDQTGPLGPVYTPAAEGVKAFFEQLNANGGVNGAPVELTVVDSQSTPEGAGALYRQAIDAEPVAIYNMSSSAGLSGVAPLLVDSGIPVLGVGASDDLLYPTPAGNIYMLQPTSEQQVRYGLGLVESLRGNLDGARIAMVGLSPSSIIDAAYEKIAAAVEAEGGEVVKIERPTSPIASFTTQAVGLADANPDAVFLNLAPADAITVANALEDAGLSVPIIVLPSSGTDAPEVFAAIDSPNYYAVRFAAIPGDTDHADLAGEEYANSAAWATGWMFGALVTQGLEKCGPGCTSDKLNDTLQNAGPFDLGDVLFAPVTYSTESHSTVSAVQFFVWDSAAGKPVAAGDVIDIDE